MRDLTHYFVDSLKTSEAPPVEREEVISKNEKVLETDKKITKTNHILKKQGKKKSKSTSPDSNISKKSKCDLGIEKIKPLLNGTKNNALENASEKSDTEDSLKIISKDRFNGNFPLNFDSKEDNGSKSQKNEQKLNDSVPKDENNVCIVRDCQEKENNVEDKKLEKKNVDISEQTSEQMESETVPIAQDNKKKRRKERIKVLAEKKGYAKRKMMEDEEAEEMEKKIQERKNIFTNVVKKDENEIEIVPKPPAYSLLNYFSKSTPEQRQKEEAAKCKISVKVEVHTPKEGDTSNTTPNSTPKSHCPKSSQNKKKRSQSKQVLSEIDEIQFVRSESLSPPPILQGKKKSNKPKWRIQFQSDNSIDLGSGSETLSPTSVSKTQEENIMSEEIVNDKSEISNYKENPGKSDNSDIKTLPITRKTRSSKQKLNKEKKNESGVGKENADKNKVNLDKINSEVDDKKEIIDTEVIILEETLPKRSAPEKIAPLFIKRRKLDPAVKEARRLFLHSDMSENGKQITKRKPSPVRNPTLPFPQISHVTQLDPDINSEMSKIKLELKSPCKYSPSLDISKFNNITSINNSIKKRWITTLDPTKPSIDIEEALSEIESRCNDARAMWKIISQSAKVDKSKQLSKGRTTKRGTAGKKVTNTEGENSIENHDNVWICKYKPMSAQEIVGNEQAAIKLKTWLDKWKMPLNKDNANSDDDFYSSDCSSSYSSNDNNQVAVLLGPYGCGKTASVYAVAEELGYSVLEINASSRRTGKKILKELEEATKSHRIKKSDMKQTFLKTKTTERKIPQNSLILMEDVDIIFEEDEGFVSAVFQLASNTKRPIVMTCNETCSHLIKLAPQQLHIQFQVAAGNRALALLELISLAETGQKLSMHCVENLLENGDLRKALLQLQYLLATGNTHVQPPVVDSQHRLGIPLWRKMHQCLYKPAVKSSKKRKKKNPNSQSSINQDIDVLDQLANNLESVSLISKLIGIDDISWDSRRLKSVMNLSLSEDTRPYSYLDTISSNIADWLTFEVIHKKEDSQMNFDQVTSKLLLRRTVNTGINSFLSQIVSTTTDRRMISEDYVPCVRAICRAEETRNSSNNKRGNRFFHYLHGTKMPSNSMNILSAASKILQEKTEKDQ